MAKSASPMLILPKFIIFVVMEIDRVLFCRPFKCDKCDTFYYRKNVLKAHAAKCTGTKQGGKTLSEASSNIGDKRQDK